MTKKQNNLILSIFGVLFIIIILIILKIGLKNKNETPIVNPIKDEELVINDNNDSYEYKLLHRVNASYKDNYLISPLSILYALSMLKDGTDGITLEELNNLFKDKETPSISNIKNVINVANGVFIKKTYENDINKKYINNLVNKYNAEAIYDELKSPDVINNWVNEKTYQMIPSIINNIDNDFVLALVNAIALKAEWQEKFDENATRPALFTKSDNTKIEVNMMHAKDSFKYIENDNAKGIIKDYAIYDTKTGKVVEKENKNTISLEYIAILPNKDLREYVNNFSQNELDSLLENITTKDDCTLYLNIPKYSYDFDYKGLKNTLQELGLNSMFNGDANLSKMVNKDSELVLYVSDVLHKTHIEFDENGTKAAAATAVIVKAFTAVKPQNESITITFDKPFMYLIRDKKSKDIYFIGSTYISDIYND